MPARPGRPAAEHSGVEEKSWMSETSGGAGFPVRGIAYLDRRYVPMEDAKISVATHAFNYGTGCFEGIRGYWSAERDEVYLVKLQEHFQRLLDSAKLLTIDVGRTAD